MPGAAYWADVEKVDFPTPMKTSNNYCTRRVGAGVVLSLFLLFCPAVWPQAVVPKPATVGVLPEPPKDTLGRDTPRKTVLRFLSTAREGNAKIAALYLNTSLRGEASENLARQLAMVLNRRLP